MADSDDGSGSEAAGDSRPSSTRSSSSGRPSHDYTGSDGSPNDSSDSDDASDALDYDDEGSDDADEMEDGVQPRRRRVWTELCRYDDLKHAQAAREMWEEFVYTYDSRYKSGFNYSRVYRCRSHANCDHRLKISRIGEPDIAFVLKEGGLHGTVLIPVKRHGIHRALKIEVDSLGGMGWGATKIRIMLSEKYENNPELLAAMPTSKQIENRKSYLVRKPEWDLKNYAGFNAWASLGLCTTKELFDEINNPADPHMDDMIILDSFVINSDGSGTPTSFGVVVTSRRVFRNVEKAVRAQGKNLVCATDGTYKLHFGGWIVVDIGTEAVTWSKQDYVHRFLPFAYMFVRTESIEAYQRMFETVRSRALTFFGLDMAVAFGSLDHSDAIASAFINVWPRIKLLTCWPHLTRNALKKAHLLSDEKKYEAMIKPHLRLLRSARSHLQFLRMSEIITDHWVQSGEAAYANWFRSVYLVKRWDRWHVNGSGVTGVIPSQQGIEAHHGAIKKTCVPSLRASTAGVIQGILPRILKYGGERLCPDSVGHYGEGPIPAAMFVKAERLVAKIPGHVKAPNYRKIHRGKNSRKRLISIHFNSSKHIVDGTNILASPVDANRSKRFDESLEGHVPQGISASEIKFELLSLQCVTVKKKTTIQPFELRPIWSSEVIEIVRSHFQCSCQSCVKTGWICSHILATLSIMNAVDLKAACKLVPIVRGPGRPTGPRPALEFDEPARGHKYWTVKALVRRFLKNPGHPLKWKVVDDFDVDSNGEREVMHFVGTVEAVGLVDGLYVWLVRYDDDDMRQYHAEELAEAARRAFFLKVPVTGE